MEVEIEELIAVKLHPPRCPKCGGTIDCLELTCLEAAGATFTLTETLNLDCRERVEGSEEYNCPECKSLLFTDEDDARTFLMGLDE